MATASEVSEHGGGHKRDTLPPTGKGKREKFADIMASLEAKLQRVEFAMADNRDKAQMDALKDSLQAEIAAMKEEIKEVKGDWSLCKMAVTQGTLSSFPSLKVDIPRPKSYNGSRNARELDNFLWDLDQYFEATDIHEENKKIKTAPLFLLDAATLWWRRVLRAFARNFTDMIKKESLFTFIDGLQSWAKLEVQRRGPQDLATAISIVKSLIDFKEVDSTKARGMANKPKLSCFLCDGNQFARDCPQRAKLAALIQDDEEEPRQEEAKVGSLRLLNAIKAKVGKAKASRKGHMYVEAKVLDFNTRALIDTGTSHNFIEVKEAKRLGLQLKEEQGWIKAVNTEARPIYGVARNVRLHIGDWCGQVDFTVVPMDDYPIVLGMEFLDGMHGIPHPLSRDHLPHGRRKRIAQGFQVAKDADMAKAAKRMKKWAGKNRQAKPPNSKQKDSRDNPWGRDNSCHGSSRRATNTPKESPYDHSGTRSAKATKCRMGRGLRILSP
ncbi:HXXXD-type acyl-transferase family protein [Actinidia rufa]|uniref:HXXXD-type acyl-transferase family protein n=1 Tax=Actinidia rufa TaxID=165716 RepID=A0A7J0E0Y1_9ERIC|nr:HXXXD-type acyl-transferase family protein [Actinidia rufa]